MQTKCNTFSRYPIPFQKMALSSKYDNHTKMRVKQTNKKQRKIQRKNLEKKCEIIMSYYCSSFRMIGVYEAANDKRHTQCLLTECGAQASHISKCCYTITQINFHWYHMTHFQVSAAVAFPSRPITVLWACHCFPWFFFFSTHFRLLLSMSLLKYTCSSASCVVDHSSPPGMELGQRFTASGLTRGMRCGYCLCGSKPDSRWKPSLN